MDFTQAYLNAPLKETIYVKNFDGSTGRLNKALYGLNQALNPTTGAKVSKKSLPYTWWKPCTTRLAL